MVKKEKLPDVIFFFYFVCEAAKTEIQREKLFVDGKKSEKNLLQIPFNDSGKFLWH